MFERRALMRARMNNPVEAFDSFASIGLAQLHAVHGIIHVENVCQTPLPSCR
jgi:hypothetical protein